MVSVDAGSTATYVYNALGERVEKHVGTSYVEYIFNPEEIQADASDRSTSCCAWEYLFLGARRFGKYASNETYFSHADKIHTMGTVTDYTGGVVQDAIYHPWGQEWTMAGTMMDERFASLNQRDSESSLDPTHFRMLSSYVGRWMSPDPAKACVLHPQERNRYAYVINGPTGRIDPHGDQLCDPFTDPFCDLSGGYCDPYLDPFCSPAACPTTTTGLLGFSLCPPGEHVGGFDTEGFLGCLGLNTFPLSIAGVTCYVAARVCAASIAALIFTEGASIPLAISSCVTALATCGITGAIIGECAKESIRCVPDEATPDLSLFGCYGSPAVPL